MKSILLIGAGRFGRHIAQKLSEMNHEVLAVDKNEERISAILPYVTRAQIGDSTKEEFLRSLGVRDYDVCIVTIGESFQDSLETTSLLHELGAQKVVARAARETHEKFLLRNGADEVVYPEKQLAAWTAIRYTSDHISEYVETGRRLMPFVAVSSAEKTGRAKTVGGINIRKKVRHQYSGCPAKRCAASGYHHRNHTIRIGHTSGSGNIFCCAEVFPHLRYCHESAL